MRIIFWLVTFVTEIDTNCSTTTSLLHTSNPHTSISISISISTFPFTFASSARYAVQYSDNFTYLYIAHSLGSLTYDDMRGIPEAIAVRSEIVKAGVVAPLIRKLQKTKDSDMRYLGALLLANLACDIDHNQSLMDAGVVPVLLRCILASPKDQRVQSNCITVLFNLSVRRPDCVKEMKKSGAQKVLQKAYDCHGVNENCQILITSLMQQLEEWDGYVGNAEEEREQDRRQEEVKEENRQQEEDDIRMSMGRASCAAIDDDIAAATADAEEDDDADMHDAVEVLVVTKSALKCGGCGSICADTSAFQQHCQEGEHDEDFGYDCEEVMVDESGCEVRDSMSSGEDTDVYGDNDSDYEYDMYAEVELD